MVLTLLDVPPCKDEARFDGVARGGDGLGVDLDVRRHHGEVLQEVLHF